MNYFLLEPVSLLFALIADLSISSPFLFKIINIFFPIWRTSHIIARCKLRRLNMQVLAPYKMVLPNIYFTIKTVIADY